MSAKVQVWFLAQMFRVIKNDQFLKVQHLNQS